MKLLHTGDWHINCNAKRLGKVYSDGSIRANRLKILEFVIQTGLNENIDAFCICGDIFDISRPYPQDYSDLLSLLDPIPQDKFVFMIHGNHDENTTKGCGLDPIAGLRRFVGLHPILYPYIKDYHILLCPWGTPLKFIQEVSNLDTIILLHAGINDKDHRWVEVEGEQGNYHLAALQAIPHKAILLSHYHNQAILTDTIRYAGSPDNVHGFSEENDNKGFYIWDLDNGDVKSYSTDHLITKYITYTPECFLNLDYNDLEAYVRVKGEVTEKERLDIIKKMKDFKCLDYKFDLTIKTKKAKGSILKGKTDKEILNNYLKSKKIENIDELLKLDKELCDR